MKKILLFVCLLVSPLSVSAELISSFSSDIVINNDASFVVVENIEYDFEEEEKHGIFRYIPVVYEQENSNDKREIHISDIEVTRNGEVERYTSKYENDNLFIKIGKTEEFVTGMHTYVLSYVVRGGIRYFENHDELYWNVTGGGWPVNMNNVTATVSMNNTKFTQSACYKGGYSENVLCLSQIRNKEVVFDSQGIITSGENMTIATGFPKGVLPEVVYIQKDYSSFFAWFGVLIIMMLGWFGIKYYKEFKKHYVKKPVVAWYEPYEKNRAIFSGTLIDGKVDSRDIVAGLLSLARDDYVKLEQTEKTTLGIFKSKDWKITLNKVLDTGVSRAEHKIIELIFGHTSAVKEEKLLGEVVGVFNKREKQKTVSTLKKDLHQDMIELGYKEKFWGVSERWTKKGYEARNYLEGFKLFLSVTEEERYKFHNAPERNPQQFMQFLPFAIAFGVEKQWAKQFESLDMSDAVWQGSNIPVASAVALVGEVDSLAKAFGVELATATISSSSGSGGGGFSGGGFGGGGGGSW